MLLVPFSFNIFNSSEFFDDFGFPFYANMYKKLFNNPDMLNPPEVETYVVIGHGFPTVFAFELNSTDSLVRLACIIVT